MGTIGNRKKWQQNNQNHRALKNVRERREPVSGICLSLGEVDASEAAHFAVRHYPRAKQYYQRKMSKTDGIVAIRALANKLACAAYHVMKDQVAFEPEKVFG